MRKHDLTGDYAVIDAELAPMIQSTRNLLAGFRAVLVVALFTGLYALPVQAMPGHGRWDYRDMQISWGEVCEVTPTRGPCHFMWHLQHGYPAR